MLVWEYYGGNELIKEKSHEIYYDESFLWQH